MKLLCNIVLASFLWATSHATIEIEDLQSHVHAGSTYKVTWANDRDYRIQDFALVQWEDCDDWTSRVRTVDHYMNTAKGIDSVYWKVPAVKNRGFYSLVMNAVEVNETGVPDPDAIANTSSNKFVIRGGPKLYRKEIVGVVSGTSVTLGLLVGLFIGVASCMRKRRSRAAADLSESNGERYTDTAQGTRR